MHEPFDACRAKINRSKHHLKQLQTDIKDGWDQDLYGIRVLNRPEFRGDSDYWELANKAGADC
jgi:hypothetical protein